MLVGKRMSSPVITISPQLPVNEAINLMRQKHIRRTPVVQDGKIVGIVSDKDLLNASPAQASSLSVWELNYLLSKIQVKDVMTRKVLTITEDTPIEEAARIMADNKIGGLPVVHGDEVVGMITETDLFKIFLELMGAREPGVRVTLLIRDERGQLARLSQEVAIGGGNFIAFGQFAADNPENRLVTFKVNGIDAETVRRLVEPYALEITDLRSFP